MTTAVAASPIIKPKLRGVLHAVGALVAIPAVWILVLHARPGIATTCALIYGASLVFLLSASGLYHTPMWSAPARGWFRRIDHAAIFLLIAGTYTPLGISGLSPSGAKVFLMWVWGGAIAGVIMSLLWEKPPKVVIAGIGITLGWISVPFGNQFLEHLPLTPIFLVVFGGLLYSLGALAYAKHWPDPAPKIFGYHEVYHLLVLTAAVCHFAAVWGLVG